MVLGCGCRPPASDATSHELIVVDHDADHVRIAVIGDYGEDGPAEASVAELVHRWSPDLIITLGDNNYDNGSAATIDANVGKHYHDFIAPYVGTYGPGSEHNRFFPSLGNHDWRAADLAPYRDYFTLPGNERYYDLRWGPAHLFAIDSDFHEPDGIDAASKQAAWLRERMQSSDASWKVVYMHHPPYSSGWHGPSVALRWPYFAWGATAVLAGHDHIYERLEIGDELYFVNGLGGNAERYSIGSPARGSQVRFNAGHGAMLIEASANRIAFRFVTVDGTVVDEIERIRGIPDWED